MSEFGPWSPCPLPGDEDDPCKQEEEGGGASSSTAAEEAWTERRRVVLHQVGLIIRKIAREENNVGVFAPMQAVNGGRRCPALEQRKLCACERDEEEKQKRAQDDNAERGECLKYWERMKENTGFLVSNYRYISPALFY